MSQWKAKLDADSSEGKRHTTFYPIDNYPYIGIIDPLTGLFLSIWTMRNLLRGSR
jgi:hypothetical protein